MDTWISESGLSEGTVMNVSVSNTPSVELCELMQLFCDRGVTQKNKGDW